MLSNLCQSVNINIFYVPLRNKVYFYTGEYFTKIRGPPPSGKKSTCWQKLSENSWKLANFPSKIMFLPYFSYFFPIILPKFSNFGFLTTFFPKIWTFSRNFTKNFFGKKCRGPWQKIDFLVKYSPVVMIKQ